MNSTAKFCLLYKGKVYIIVTVTIDCYKESKASATAGLKKRVITTVLVTLELVSCYEVRLMDRKRASILSINHRAQAEIVLLVSSASQELNLHFL